MTRQLVLINPSGAGRHQGVREGFPGKTAALGGEGGRDVTWQRAAAPGKMPRGKDLGTEDMSESWSDWRWDCGAVIQDERAREAGSDCAWPRQDTVRV